MKKIYTFIAATIFAGTAIAQAPLNLKAELKKTIDLQKSNSRNFGTDTTGWTGSGNFIPEFAGVSNQATLYGYQDQAGNPNGYIFGTNWETAFSLNECAQGYVNLDEATVTIKEVLLYLGIVAYKSNDATSKAVVKLYNIAPNRALNDNGAGGAALNSPGPATTTLTTQDILVQNMTDVALTSVVLTTPVTVNKDFAIGFDVTNCKAKGDTVALVTDSDGDALGQDYAFNKVNNSWYVTNFAFGGLDVNIGMFAVVDDLTAVHEYYNGIKISNYPNPAADFTTINYSLEKSVNVTIEVIDNTGKKIASFVEGVKPAGDHSVKFNTADLAAGAYYYTIFTDNGRITKKIIKN
jgi:hypothetical protein